MLIRSCVLAAILVSLMPVRASADLVPGSPVLIVNLSDPDKGFTVISARTFNDAIQTQSPDAWAPDAQRALELGRQANPALAIRTATPLERAIGSCRTEPGRRGVPEAAKPFVARLYNCVSCFQAYGEKRFFTKEGDQVVLIVLYDASQIDPTMIRPAFREAPRQSELVATARALAGLFRQESRPEPDPACEAFVYTLQRSRSTFTVSIAIPTARGDDRRAAAEPAVDPVDPVTPGAAAKVVTSPELILGPPERWIFSTDFSFSSTSVHLGETPVADEEKVDSHDFFIALNFALSDLLPDRDARLQRRSLWRELLVKFQVTPSKRPWESWAFGVGLRGYRIKTILWNMDVVHPYFTVGRETLEEGGARWRTVAGLGFDPRSLAK